MTSGHRPPSRIDPGRLIAAIPAPVRFRPTDSVVVVGFTSTETTPLARCGCVLRIDIPAAMDVPAASEQLSTAVIANEIDLVAVVIIAEAGDRTEGLPHRGLQRELVRVFEEAHVEVTDVLWVARIGPGAPWRSYRDPGRAGTLADPNTSPVTAIAVFAGEPIYGSRAELVAHLAADPEPVLARRAALLAAQPPVLPDHGARLIHAILDRIAANAGAEVVLDDDTVVAAAHALTHDAVRNVCLAWLLTEQAEAAVRLWTVLTRRSPRPVVAHPAGLLAAAVYLRGDGTLANVAVDIALAADPTHLLAQVVRTCLDHSVAPDRFRQLLTDSIEATDPAVVPTAG